MPISTSRFRLCVSVWPYHAKWNCGFGTPVWVEKIMLDVQSWWLRSMHWIDLKAKLNRVCHRKFAFICFCERTCTRGASANTLPDTVIDTHARMHARMHTNEWDAHAHAHAHAHVHAHAPSRARANTHTQAHIEKVSITRKLNLEILYVCLQVSHFVLPTYVRARVYACTRVCVYVRMWICVYACTCACVR